jgi:hypothetical protein
VYKTHVEEGKMVGLYNVKRYKKKTKMYMQAAKLPKNLQNVTIIPNKHCKVGFKQE